MSAGRITLLTDFGTADGYVAAVRGVIAATTPEARVEDASHAIGPGDVHAAAWVLSRYWNLYPPGTVHLVVVDPGVGTERRPLAVEADGRLFVAPDNGVLTRVLDRATRWAAWAIADPTIPREPVAPTFHGRDIFAPAAARLAGGLRIREVGPAVVEPVRLRLPRPARSEDGVLGTVVHVDRFGNLITDVPADWVGSTDVIEVDGRPVGPLRRTYADAAPEALLAVAGSAGTVEVSVRDGSAADRLGAGRGTGVRVRRGGS
jgi:S-adenosylmethionine hydrolase